MRRNGNAERENRGTEAGGAWEGYPLFSGGSVWGGGCPPHQKIFWFSVWQWCILVHSERCFNVSIRSVKQSRKAVLCANYHVTWWTYHRWYHTHEHISQSAVSLPWKKLQLAIKVYRKKQRERRLYKKEREQCSHAFPSDSNPVYVCSLFCEFCDFDNFAKITGCEYAIFSALLSSASKNVKIKGSKII